MQSSECITLDLYRKRPGGRWRTGTALGPGRFGSSRKKEAAGAARGMPLAMGFECRFFRDGVKECRFVWKAETKILANRVGFEMKREPGSGGKHTFSRSRHTGSEALPKAHQESHEGGRSKSCQGVHLFGVAPRGADGLRAVR
jgi:hypothetical protein